MEDSSFGGNAFPEIAGAKNRGDQYPEDGKG
jgi:hypothetical protein